MSQKSEKSDRSSWMESAYSSYVFVFTKEGNLDIGPSSNWGVLTPIENDRIYNEYNDCVIPFY